MAPSHYIAALPSGTDLDPAIPAFFTNFYTISDDPSEPAHEQYARSFTDTATVIMGVKKVTGYDAILDFRKGLWSGPVQRRKHSIFKIYPFGERAHEVMLYGIVEYRLKNGKDVTVEWAGRAEMVKEEGEGEGGWKMAFYQVYMDSAPVIAATKE